MSNVIIYTLPTCSICKATKEFFKENNVSYEERDVTETENREKMLQKSNQLSVPVTDIDGNIIIGLEKEKLSSLLGIN